MQMRAMDDDLAWCLEFLEQDADLMSEINGFDDEGTQAARRLEVTFRRLLSEAGYATEINGHNGGIC